jgi:hypothetical protein
MAVDHPQAGVVGVELDRQRLPGKDDRGVFTRPAGVAGGAGVPTAVIPNPLFSRMTAVQWWNSRSSPPPPLLGGLTIATYLRATATKDTATKAAGGGLLSALAIGCPVCNKLVVAALGFSGALTIWTPLQPLLGLASVVLLGWALRTRLAGERGCPVPTR